MNSSPSLPDDFPPVPRRNGEIVFNTPWESRAFGLAIKLEQSGVWNWSAFAARLDGVDVSTEDTGHFYQHWLEALEKLLQEHALLDVSEIDTRIAEQTADAHQHPH